MKSENTSQLPRCNIRAIYIYAQTLRHGSAQGGVENAAIANGGH